MGLKTNAKYLLRQFPFIYPRKIIASCQEWIDLQGKRKGLYFSQRGPWYKEIFPAGFVHNPAPQTFGEPNEKAFFANRSYPTAKAGLFYLQNSYVMGHKGYILSAKHELFQEFTHDFNSGTLKKFIRKNPFYTFSATVKKMNGTGAVLVSPESHNYYHWLSDVLPRIRLYESVLGQIDHFCVASNVPQKFLDILPEFGITPDKIILFGEKEKLHFDHLFIASLPGSEGRAPKWAVEYVRKKLVTKICPKPFKKIYFKRSDVVERKLLNEVEIIEALRQNGFEITDPGQLSLTEQVSLMAEAKVIVSAHGAALINLLFCPNGTSVIELFSPDYFRTDCYYTLASILKYDYRYIAGEKPANGNWGDVLLDLQTLNRSIGN
jgi:capsular polysaccharide biosynthesis protein